MTPADRPTRRPVRRAVAVMIAASLVAAGCTSGSSSDDSSSASGTAPEACAAAGGGTPVTGAPSTGADGAPEIGTGYRSGMVAVTTPEYSVATANPLATEAACAVLRDGGTAADALVTAQTVLGLVEPQSSGIGGGAFLMYLDGETGELQAYDGRETAPASATGDYLRYVDDVPPTDRPANLGAPVPDARSSGRAVGVPGAVRLLERVHADHGRTDWRELFDPAVRLADDGFPIGERMASSIAGSAPQLALDPVRLQDQVRR